MDQKHYPQPCHSRKTILCDAGLDTSFQYGQAWLTTPILHCTSRQVFLARVRGNFLVMADPAQLLDQDDRLSLAKLQPHIVAAEDIFEAP